MADTVVWLKENELLKQRNADLAAEIERLRAERAAIDQKPPATELSKLRCIFCDFTGDSLASLRVHSSECEKHPLMKRIADIKHKSRDAMLSWMDALHSRHSPPDRCDTYAAKQCEKCKSFMLWNNGDVNDLTAMDIAVVKCWNCGEVEKLDQDISEFLVYSEDAEDTLPRPEDMKARIAELEAELAERTQELAIFRHKMQEIVELTTCEETRQQARELLARHDAGKGDGDDHAEP